MTSVSPGQPPRQLRPTEVKRLNREWRRATEARLALLLDSVAQPFNVGSIIRTAAAFGAGQLWLCGGTAPLSHPSVGKTALGTERFLVAEQEPSPVAAAKAAAAMGLRVVAVELASGAVPLHEAPLDGDVCLAIGNEDHGCSAALLAVADAVAYIPQPSRVGSFNVAAAAAIAMAEARRREWTLLLPPPFIALHLQFIVFPQAAEILRPCRLRPCRFRSWTIRGRSRSRTAVARRTPRRTRGPRSNTRSGWVTSIWRPTPGPPRTVGWSRSTTGRWTGSPTRTAPSARGGTRISPRCGSRAPSPSR
jgi:tRNA (guanosine-2'-O-)-methyltransferase